VLADLAGRNKQKETWANRTPAQNEETAKKHKKAMADRAPAQQEASVKKHKKAMQEPDENGETGSQRNRAPKLLSSKDSYSAEYQAEEMQLQKQREGTTLQSRNNYRRQQATQKKQSEQAITLLDVEGITLLIADIAKSDLPPAEKLQ
jgi:hypothetical protein